MECVKSALKKSFRGETTTKPSLQVGNDDVFVVNVQSVDDFFVDDLLNFSNDDGGEEEDGEEPGKPRNDVVEDCDKKNDNFVSAFDHTATELTVPADELANLEWLSHFVEDSFSEFNTTPFLSPANPKKTEISTVVEAKPPCFSSPVPAKARTKRSRTGGRVWSTLTESTSSSSSSSSSSTVQSRDPTGTVEKPAKKPRKKPCGESGPGPARRCSHCGVQKTPQWRTGPNGAKTLCNACGVRFKSGRLLPEYRPACSPTFSSDLHSNHHRKVLEMRKKKDDGTVFLPRTGSGF